MNVGKLYGLQCHDMVNPIMCHQFLAIILILCPALTKLANVLWTRELQKHLDSDNIPITAITLHPGTVNTSISDRLPFPRASRWLMNLFLAMPDRGAFTSLIAAASPAVRADPQKYKGVYLQPVGELVEPSDQAKDPKLAEELWRTTESYLEGIGL
jgi:NAD(P)-dependent dehydrogenase (short-subunit alcohol dehydrogenase family)